ncbi:hypothetical protein HOR87_gp53 [Marinomonas phage CB5A]|uniref:Uncharacterized protein n=3 Tax=Murciavirus TaxID=2731675 RepID=A0A1W5S499_9CAUD|nr:hypothetical protein HOR72_gp22 [Marinomonas phage CPP1m]YP_009791142.1 hypothetical protein HOR87_gp53 [Marinomonas phage CB5A]ARB11268.1 hypothetical protein [Marinomonas phage CPP1m]ARB11318.1 hypothetical protein [Marinomonas phage CPG1g]ASP46291.1 hypothetical protein [Marinomonas phage CB5A]
MCKLYSVLKCIAVVLTGIALGMYLLMVSEVVQGHEYKPVACVPSYTEKGVTFYTVASVSCDYSKHLISKQRYDDLMHCFESPMDCVLLKGGSND